MKSTLRDSDNENDPYPPAKRKKITSSCRVPSLMEIAIDFVASNLHHVESFCGFPDIVGQEIFRRAELMKRFDISNDGDAGCLRLFIDSYGALVLSQLNLSGCHLGVNYALDNLLHFKSLEELDVSACGLGDSHEFLPYIGHLESLRKLNLSSNSLTDEGMRKLTTPYRVCGKGPKHLEICDISDNPTISSKSIQRLSSFPELHTVDVTKTQIKSDAVLMKQWQFKPIKSDCLLEISNKGWATGVVSQWMKFAEQKIVKETKRDSKFYSKTHLKKDFSVTSDNMKSAPGYRLLLVRSRLQSVQPTSNIPVHQNSRYSELSTNTTSKDESCDNKPSPVVDPDDELFTMYSVENTRSIEVNEKSNVSSARRTKRCNVFKVNKSSK